MIQVLLLIQLIIAVALVFVILIQRSEGGGLGIGGGGGMMSTRGVANMLTRATAVLAAVFISLSLILTVLAGNRDEATSVVDVLEEDALDADGLPAISLPSNAGVGAEDETPANEDSGDDSEANDGGAGDENGN